jgi:quercetin dioxygenase-like cupin family protein
LPAGLQFGIEELHMALTKGVEATKRETILPPGAGESLNVIGDHQTVKLTGEHTGGLFALLEQNNDAGAGVPLHVHTREDELFYVCEGEMAFFIGGKEVVGIAGTTVYLPRGVPHGFRVNKKTRALVSVYPAGLEKMFCKLDELPPGPADFEKVKAICGEFGIYFE